MSASNVVTVPAEISREVEVVAKPTRRRFTAEYKHQVLRAADACTKPGEIGALLRREGLYFSHIKTWREQRRKGELAGLAQRRRGPTPKDKNPLTATVVALEREVTRQKARAARAEALVDLQKKVSEILGVELNRNREKD